MSLLQEFAGFAEEWLRDFTGREWLIQQVREFLDDPQAPHFLLIIGEPGIGKSAFAAYLWQRAQIPDAVHFCIGGRGGTTEPLGFVHSIAEQLAGRVPGFAKALVKAQETFADRSVIIHTTQHIRSVQGGDITGVRIQHLEIQGLPPERAFDRLIRHPLRALDEEGNLPATIILVDALDEAVVHVSRPGIVEILRQAHDLPTQIRFILTSRPEPSVLNSFADRPHISIEAQNPENQEDITHYLGSLRQRDEQLQDALANAGWDEAQFIRDLGDMGEWNFLYLSLVLPEIIAGHFLLGEDALPRGLDGYYQYLLGTRVRTEEWRQWGADLMEIVLALQEPASLEQIAAYLEWPERRTRQRLEQVSQLLDLTLWQQELFWRYHWSVANFLIDRKRAGEFWCDERQGHARIANFYLTLWGGVEDRLPRLQEPEKRDMYGGYGLRHLAVHLEGAGRTDDLHRLLRLDRPVSERWENVWFAAKEATGGLGSYLADVARAWRQAEATKDVGMQVRCALCRSSVASLSANLPGTLLARAAEHRLLWPEQAVTLARGKPEKRERVAALVQLAPHLPAWLREETLEEALAAAREIGGAHDQARAPSHRYLHLSPWQSVASPWQRMELAALAAAPEIADGWRLAKALTEMAPHLPGRLLEEALAAAREIGDAGGRVQALVGLAPHLPEPLREQVLGEALAAAQDIKDGHWQGWALVHRGGRLGPWRPLQEQVPGEALTAAREIASRWGGGEALVLVDLAPHLPERLREEALAAAQKIRNADDRVEALISLAPHLPDPLREQVLREALAAAREIRWDQARAEVLGSLAPHLPVPLREQMVGEALAAARKIWNADDRAQTLGALAPHLPVPLREQTVGEALAAVRKIWNANDRAQALGALAPYLPERLLEEALAAARKIRDAGSRAQALSALAPYLPDRLLEEALAAARKTKHEKWRVEALVGLVPHLTSPLREQVLGEALATARRIGDADDRARALRARGLSRQRRSAHTLRGKSKTSKVTTSSTYVESTGWGSLVPMDVIVLVSRLRARALSALAPHVPEQLRERVLGKALTAARKIAELGSRAQALSNLAPYLPERLLGEALVTAREIRWDQARAEVLGSLAPHLPVPLQRQVVEEALAAARKIQRGEVRVEVLVGVALHLPEPLREQVLEEALAAAREIEYEGNCAKALRSLAPHLSAELLEKALAAAREIEHEGGRADALSGLAPHLSAELLGQALTAAREIGDAQKRAQVLYDLAPNLTELSGSALMHLWLEDWDGASLLHALAHRPRPHLLADLVALAPVIAAMGGEEALGEAFRAIQDVGHWWP
ncbi:MAG TPA: hypothetical protein VMY40_11135 [Anaerolineae bacterium]|nr:hypothetical protein [Anaerolineae bacterium]